MHELKSLTSEFGEVITTQKKSRKEERRAQGCASSGLNEDLDPGLLSPEATFITVPFLAFPWLFPSPGPHWTPPSPILSRAQDGRLTVGRVAWGTGCVLQDDGHQGLADGRLPGPGSLSPLSAGTPWGPARRLAHEVGGIGSDNLKAVWVGAWWHKAEVLGGLHSEDF